MSFALVAHTEATIAGSGASNPSPAIDTTGADLLVAVCAGFAGVGTVSDSKGNTWTPLTARGTGGSTVQIFYVAAPTAGAGHTFTVGGALLVAGSIAVTAWSGSAASPFDVENGGAGSGASVQTGTVIPSEDDELIVAGVCFYPSGTVSIGGGFSISDQIDYESGQHMGVGEAYLVQTTAAAADPAWTHSGFTDAAVAIATFKAAGGGTTTADYDGSCTPSGSLARLVAKALAGSSTASGSAAKLAARPLAGSLTPSGVLARLTAKPLAGSSTPSGTLAEQAQKSLAGSSTPSGDLTGLKVAIKNLDGSCTPSGSAAKAASKAAAGSATAAGSLANQARKPLAGSSTPFGTLATVKVVLKSLAGAVSAAGSLAKSVLKALAGLVTGSGSLATSGGASAATPGRVELVGTDSTRAAVVATDSSRAELTGSTGVAEPEIQAFRLAVGQAKTLVFTMDDPPEGGVSSWDMRFRLRRPGRAVLVEKTSGGGITCADPDAGVWEVAIVEADTFDEAEGEVIVPPGVYEWSLWRTDDDTENPTAYGTCTVYRTAETG